MSNLPAVHGDRRTAHSLHYCPHVSPLSRRQLQTHSSTTSLQREWPSCITLNHREIPSLHHEEIIVKREEVAMILTSLCEHPGKEQREWSSGNGAHNAP